MSISVSVNVGVGHTKKKKRKGEKEEKMRRSHTARDKMAILRGFSLMVVAVVVVATFLCSGALLFEYSFLTYLAFLTRF